MDTVRGCTVSRLDTAGLARREVTGYRAWRDALTEVGLSVDDVDDLTRVAEAATAEGETIHAMPFTVRVPDVVDALRSIEGFSRSVRAEAGLPEPVPHRAH